MEICLDFRDPFGIFEGFEGFLKELVDSLWFYGDLKDY